MMMTLDGWKGYFRGIVEDGEDPMDWMQLRMQLSPAGDRVEWQVCPIDDISMYIKMGFAADPILAAIAGWAAMRKEARDAEELMAHESEPKLYRTKKEHF